MGAERSSGVKQWQDLTQDERDRLSIFLMAVNSDIAFVDGRMTRPEANLPSMFQPILARSRSDFVRQVLFNLSDRLDDIETRYMRAEGSGDPRHVTPWVAGVRAILEAIGAEDRRRYLAAVAYIGLVTAKADGAMFGDKMSRDERSRLEAILAEFDVRPFTSDGRLADWMHDG